MRMNILVRSIFSMNTIILLGIIVLLSACTEDKINPISDVNQDGLPSAEFMKQLEKNEKAPVPANLEIPDLTEKKMTNISLRNELCTSISYGDWHDTPIGRVWAKAPDSDLFYSSKYNDWIIIENHENICNDSGILWKSNRPICGRAGYFLKYNTGDMIYWNGSYWEKVSCEICDFSSRFMKYINDYSHLEGNASSSGAINFANDLFTFRDLVDTNAPLDIKNTNESLVQLKENKCGVDFFGREVATDVPGNVLYGFMGYLFWKDKFPDNSFSALFLGAAAGLAQGISDGEILEAPYSAPLLLDPGDFLKLTSYDQWCDTWAIYFGVDMAAKHGADITIDQMINGVNSINTYLNDADFNCPGGSPTGYCEDGTFGPCD